MNRARIHFVEEKTWGITPEPPRPRQNKGWALLRSIRSWWRSMQGCEKHGGRHMQSHYMYGSWCGACDEDAKQKS
jgi:hypothetical protein